MILVPNKKVLIISYYWPPAGGPGVQRVLKFAKYLPQFGWQPIILTVKNPTSPATDSSLLDHIPDECIIYKTDTSEPFNFYRKFTGKSKNQAIPKDIIVRKEGERFSEKMSRLLRANIFIPDARRGWISHIVKEGKKIVQSEKPDLIFSTSPPHSLQIGARKLAYKTGLKWVADFRDPWVETYWESDIEKSRLSQRINRNYEANVLKTANHITTVSDGIVELLSQKATNNFSTLYNGYDKLYLDSPTSDRFKIIFIGNLSKYQSPEPLLKAIDLLPEQIRSQITCEFIGKVFDDHLELFQKYNRINIVCTPYMPYDELMKYSKTADLLLLIFHQTSYTLGYMTAKIFDYLALRKPILAIGLKGAIGEKVLKETESGRLFDYGEPQEIAKYIEKHFNLWKQKPDAQLEANDALLTYSTRENVKKLVSIFEGLIY